MPVSVTRNLWSSWAASASLYPPPPPGLTTLSVTKAEADQFRVGGYAEHDGRMWKVASKTPSTDWFEDVYYVRLTGAGYELGDVAFASLMSRLPTWSALDEKISWLEDQAFPGLAGLA